MVYHQRSLQLVLFLLSASLLFSCTEGQKSNENSPNEPQTREYPELFQQVLDAHGGIEQWNKMRLLEYDLYMDTTFVDHQTIDLKNRKVLLKNEEYSVGFDGSQVWYIGNEEEFSGGSAKFYHNLQFYFFSLPFAFADPGVIYEELEDREFQGKTYDVLRFIYESGVGDSPDDEYIIYVDQETHQMELLLYTVTYFSGKPEDKYGARWYSEWQDVNGVKLPLVSRRYKWTGDSLGDLYYPNRYLNVVLKEGEPDQSQFAKPENAKISD